MTDDSIPRPARRTKAGYPLAALALLVTMLACLLVCADLERWRAQYAWLEIDWPARLVLLFGGASLFGGLVGGAYLLFAAASWRSGFVAVLAGVLAGPLGALILVAPGPIWRVIFAVGILLATAVLFRLDAE